MRNSSVFHPDNCGFSVHIPSDKYVANQASACVVYIILFIPTVLLNGISIFVIQKSSQLKEKPCYFVIRIQSAIDVAIGVLSLPLHATHILLKDIVHVENRLICWINFMVSYFLVSFSLLTLCGLSFERYLGVVHPFVHRTHVTKKRILKYECCAGFLILAALFIMPESVSDVFELMFMFAEALFSLVLLVFVYTRIFITARKSIRSVNGPVGNAVADNSGKSSKGSFLKEVKLAKSCFLVVCTFGLCYLPLMALLLSLNALNAEMLEMLWSWALCLSFLNSSLNSIIFFWSKKQLRKEVKKLLGCSKI